MPINILKLPPPPLPQSIHIGHLIICIVISCKYNWTLVLYYGKVNGFFSMKIIRNAS